MCIIAVKPSSKAMMNDETIREMFSRNRDGAGIMFLENDSVHIKKGFMTVNSFLEYIHSRDWTGVPAVLHFRIGTAGPNNEMNCHPYPVGMENSIECNCEVGMAHNGILYEYNPPRGSQINDTQVFMNTIISKLPSGWLHNEAICELVRYNIGTNRLAFLTKGGEIFRFGDWIEDDGYFYSNSSYKPYNYRPFEVKSEVKSVNNKSTFGTVSDDPCKDLLNNWPKSPTLSFESRFVPIGMTTERAEAHTVVEYNNWIEEMERKLDCLDTEIWEDFDHIYEADSQDWAIYRNIYEYE